MDGYYGDGYEDGFGDGDDDGYYGEGDGTRDFLSQPISSGGTYPVPRVDMAALDLNSEGPVGGFRGLLHSGGVPQGINLSTGSPPFYFRGGGRTLGLRGHRPATVGRSSSSVAGAGRGAVAPPLPARAATSDVPEGSRSRPARPRSPTTAGAEDSSNNNSNAVEDVEILTNNPMPTKSRADWSEANTDKLCKIWCHQINIGNCSKGIMNKTGMKEVIKQYHAATSLLHDRDQIGHRYRQLKGMWQFIKDCRNDTGLGRNTDGTVIADDAWWANKTKKNSEWRKLKHGWPEYMQEMEQMFQGVACDGSTAYVPGAVDIKDPVYDLEEPSPIEGTPSSSSRKKRASSTSTCASSPSKKSKSKNQAIQMMDRVLSEQARIQEDRNKVLERQVEMKALMKMKSKEEKRKAKEEEAQKKLMKKKQKRRLRKKK